MSKLFQNTFKFKKVQMQMQILFKSIWNAFKCKGICIWPHFWTAHNTLKNLWELEWELHIFLIDLSMGQLNLVWVIKFWRLPVQLAGNDFRQYFSPGTFMKFKEHVLIFKKLFFRQISPRITQNVLCQTCLRFMRIHSNGLWILLWKERRKTCIRTWCTNQMTLSFYKTGKNYWNVLAF